MWCRSRKSYRGPVSARSTHSRTYMRRSNRSADHKRRRKPVALEKAGTNIENLSNGPLSGLDSGGGPETRGRLALKGEASVKRAIEDLCRAERIPYWRMNSGNLVIPSRGRVRLNEAGTADLLLAPNCPRGMMNLPTPVFLWIECKRPDGGRITDEQLRFADEVRERGHYHMFVSDVRDLQDWLKDNRAR